ncbi:hypothetical protein CRG98_011542 [Punica granatum]|uniref:Uncharacterized protein n=1 Tax=Punica granatum TaxID=22663 RepID=A0A2I0KJI1_PUNGR|nr:hypothetical protein CRG98_011542 [Punica granatum]
MELPLRSKGVGREQGMVWGVGSPADLPTGEVARGFKGLRRPCQAGRLLVGEPPTRAP